MSLLQRLFFLLAFLFGDRTVASLALPSSPLMLACLLNCWWDTEVTYVFIHVLLILVYCSNIPLKIAWNSMPACRVMNCNSLGRPEMGLPVQITQRRDANKGSLLYSAARRGTGWSLQAGPISHSLGILWGPRIWAHSGWCEIWCRGKTCFTFPSLLCVMSWLWHFLLMIHHSSSFCRDLHRTRGGEVIIEEFGRVLLHLARAVLRTEGLL